MNNHERVSRFNRAPGVFAIMSGKGGSGKTMIAATLAVELARVGPTILIDADTGTAGLSYYLGVEQVHNTRVGLSNLVARTGESVAEVESVVPYLQEVQDFPDLRFLSVGDHRRLVRYSSSHDIAESLEKVVRECSSIAEFVVADCRGGVDEESLAVCRASDQIVLVTETDITAYQATRHLVDVLSDEKLAHKLSGFFLNKVFQNPKQIQSRGTSEFGCRFLSALPYDLEASRDFYVGDLPIRSSTFGLHVRHGLSRLMPDRIEDPVSRVWTPQQYDSAGLIDPDGRRGGVVVGALLLLLAVVWIAREFIYIGPGPTTYLSSWAFMLTTVALGLIGAAPAGRRAVGRGVSAYARVVGRLVEVFVPERRR